MYTWDCATITCCPCGPIVGQLWSYLIQIILIFRKMWLIWGLLFSVYTRHIMSFQHENMYKNEERKTNLKSQPIEKYSTFSLKGRTCTSHRVQFLQRASYFYGELKGSCLAKLVLFQNQFLMLTVFWNESPSYT